MVLRLNPVGFSFCLVIVICYTSISLRVQTRLVWASCEEAVWGVCPPPPRLVFVLFAAISISCYGLSEAGVSDDTATDRLSWNYVQSNQGWIVSCMRCSSLKSLVFKELLINVRQTTFKPLIDFSSFLYQLQSVVNSSCIAPSIISLCISIKQTKAPAMNAIKSFLCILLKGAIFMFLLTLIVLMSILADLTPHTLIYRVWELESISVFKKKSGTVAILYFDNLCHEESIISLCINGFVYVSNSWCKNLSWNHVKTRSSIPRTAVHRICVFV